MIHPELNSRMDWTDSSGHASLALGNCVEQMASWPEQSVQCCVTSPPYYGLRDYGTATWAGGDPKCDHKNDTTIQTGQSEGHSTDQDSRQGTMKPYRDVCGKCGATRIDDQIGLEQSPEEYVAKMVEVFRQVHRVLRDDGTLWLNLGDSYNAAGRKGQGTRDGYKQGTNRASAAGSDTCRSSDPSLKHKELIGIPWRVALALQADGWYLRQDIIWHKPNPMPESVRDRCTKAHEYLFLLSKKPKYHFDHTAMKEAAVYAGQHRGGSKKRYEQNEAGMDNKKYATRNKRSVWSVESTGNRERECIAIIESDLSPADKWASIKEMMNDGQQSDVWKIKPAVFKGAHFATFPPDLIRPCILAGCPEGGTVLDPFAGSGTTLAVAKEHGRFGVGCELNHEYVTLAIDRIEGVK